MLVCRKRVLSAERVSVGGGGLRSSIATAQSRERRCLVRARPMPELAPVMRATGGAIVTGCIRAGVVVVRFCGRRAGRAGAPDLVEMERRRRSVDETYSGPTLTVLCEWDIYSPLSW